MLAALLAIGLFVAWWAVGLAGLIALRTNVRELRVSLSAPIIGTAMTVLPLFVLSEAGVPMETAGPPVAALLLGLTILVLVRRRPRLPPAAAPVAVLAVLDLVLVGRPMFHFGFDWIANANSDMGFYVLAATELLHHGVLSPVDLRALAHHHGFPTLAQRLSLRGIRPGAQITVAGISAVTGRSPLGVYMPTLLAMNMSCVCAVGSLAMQGSRRWWAAAVAAGLLVASPLAGFGVLQQLMPQVWGLGLAVAVASWLMRPEMHRNPGPPISDLAVVAVLVGSLFVVYVELGSSLLIAYGIYVVLLAFRRGLSLRAVALLWGVPVAFTLLVASLYLPYEIKYLRAGAQFGLSVSHGGVRLFGYSIVPTALPGITGIQKLTSSPTTSHMGASIVISAVLLIGLLVIAVLGARKGVAAAAVVLGDAVLAVFLGAKANDFGLFKLYMYLQPFAAATVAVWLASLRARAALVTAGAALALLVSVQVSRLDAYVAQSRNPVGLRHASERAVLPAFQRLLNTATAPVVSATENIALLELEGAIAGEHKRLYFLDWNTFNLHWQKARFRVPLRRGSTVVAFSFDRRTSKILSHGSCVVSMPSGSQLPLNRRSLPEGSPDFASVPCKRAKDLLAFVVSNRGQPATLPIDNRAVSMWPLVNDPLFPGHTLSGFGRFALFQILGATPKVRLALTFSTSPLQRRDGSFALPPAAVAGSERVGLPVVGSGSARVFSAPLRPKVIGGRPYLVLDMGENGQLSSVDRPGLTKLWGSSVTLDPRFLTSYVRDISILSPSEYSRLRAPSAIRRIPADLGNPNLEYSGIFEDGWIGRDSYAVLAGGPAGRVNVSATILPQAPPRKLRVAVNGRTVYSGRVGPGELKLHVPIPASLARRKVELHWSGAARLSPQDRRSAAARLTYLGVT